MNVKKIITLLLALVLAAGMVACGTKPAEDTDGNDGSEEAKALYEQLMAQENAILSENTALWEKVFMAADKGMAMIEDGGNYGDFLLKTIENTKDQFTEEELTLLTGEATKIKDIENQRAELETKYPWLSETPDGDDNTSVPAGSDMTTPPDDGSMQKFPAFEGKDLDGNTVKSSELFAKNAVTVVNFWFTTCNPCVGRRPHRCQHLHAGRRRDGHFRGQGCACQEGRDLSERVFCFRWRGRQVHHQYLCLSHHLCG